MFGEIDLDELLMNKVRKAGGRDDDFKKLSSLISEYSAKSGMPEDGIALIVIDSLGCGASREDIEKQLKVYDSKRINFISDI